MPKQSQYFLFDDLRYIYYVDEAHETIYFEVINFIKFNKMPIFIFNLQDQLTAAYYACNNRRTNIILSKPDSLIYIEDLVISLSLDELKQIFFNGIDFIRKL